MFFEFSIARKYLTPRKKQLAVSLIALLSVCVISLVVWLVLLFLSITEGMEKSWLKRLTTLNAPIKIYPTQNYFSSYYYLSDQFSSASQYSSKTILQKLRTSHSDPYNPEIDFELPQAISLPDLDSNGSLKDPVKQGFQILSQLKANQIITAFQEYEMSGALLRLQLLRLDSRPTFGSTIETQNFLTQVSYLASFPNHCPTISELLTSPTTQDLNNLFYISTRNLSSSTQDLPLETLEEPSLISKRLNTLLQNIELKEVKTKSHLWKLPYTLLANSSSLDVIAHFRHQKLSYLTLKENEEVSSLAVNTQLGSLETVGDNHYFKRQDGSKILIDETVPLYLNSDLNFQASLFQGLKEAQKIQDLKIKISGKVQKQPVSGEIPLENLEISRAEIKTQFKSSPNLSPPWVYAEESENNLTWNLPKDDQGAWGILLAKNFQDNGVRIGDKGYLSYSASTLNALTEQRIAVYVAGFYDSGILSIGNKCILVDPEITRTINKSSSFYNLDKNLSNGIQVWISDLNEVEKIKHKLINAFAASGIDSYWTVSTFKEYDFAKDLLQQFESDKYLFTLIAIIILVVAICNIISFLVLLVSDKKKEIGILQSMGASKFSIAAIFGICGATIGIISSFIGILLALLTLHNINFVVDALSFLQGREAFNALFFGKSLPNQLSSHALYFILIATPLLSILAGLIPAIKACRLKPAAILRSE